MLVATDAPGVSILSLPMMPLKIPAITQIDNFLITKTRDYWIKSDNSDYYKYNPATHQLKAYPNINSSGIYGDKQPIIEDSRGMLLFSGHGGLFYLLNTATEHLDSISINTDPDNQLNNKAITTAIYEDKNGVFWIDTQQGFAKVVLDKSTGLSPRVQWFCNNSSNRNSLTYNYVSCFLNDPADPGRYIWVATKGGGMNRLDKTTGDFYHITIKEDLPDNVDTEY